MGRTTPSVPRSDAQVSSADEIQTQRCPRAAHDWPTVLLSTTTPAVRTTPNRQEGIRLHVEARHLSSIFEPVGKPVVARAQKRRLVPTVWRLSTFKRGNSCRPLPAAALTWFHHLPRRQNYIYKTWFGQGISPNTNCQVRHSQDRSHNAVRTIRIPRNVLRFAQRIANVPTSREWHVTRTKLCLRLHWRRAHCVQHEQHVRTVLKRLQDFGISVNPAKCVFAVVSLNFLGHVLDENGCRFNPDRVVAICEWPRPATKKWLQRFLAPTVHPSIFTIGSYRTQWHCRPRCTTCWPK